MYQDYAGMPDFDKQDELVNNMRLSWVQHVYWARMLLISIAGSLEDLPEVTGRLLQNPHDIARVFAPYYASGPIAALLTEHLQIGAELIAALRDKDESKADELNKEWYENADKMAEAFSGLNPHYELEALRGMMHQHLELTSAEVAARLAGDYQADIAAFNKAEKEALMMADYFAGGIMRQFPHKFAR